MTSKTSKKKILPIPKEAKQCSKYASELTPAQILEGIRAISERGLKWNGAPGEAFLKSEERLVLESGLIQSMENFDRAEFLSLLDGLKKAKACFAGFRSHVRTGLFFLLQKHLLDCDHNELIGLINSLAGLKFDWNNVIPIQQIRFAQKLEEQIPNMSANALASVLTGLSHMLLKWNQLKVFYGDLRVDLRESIADQMIAWYNDFCLKDKINILEALGKMEYVKGRYPEKMQDLCVAFLTNCIQECVGNQAKKVWLLYKKLAFGKKDLGTELHLSLKEVVYGRSTPSTMSKQKRLKRKVVLRPEQHESPHPYYDYKP